MYQFSLQYPFTADVSPYSDELEADIENWLNATYSAMPPAIIEKYRQARFGKLFARLFPWAEYYKLEIFTRYLLWATMIEDYHRHIPQEELIVLGDRLTEIFRGGSPGDNVFFREAAAIRDKLRAIADKTWMESFANAFNDYYTHGLAAAAPFISRGTFPPLPLFVLIRQRSIGSYPFLAFLLIADDYPLANADLLHPLVSQMQSLVARIIAWENDFFSLQRKKDTNEACTNLVLVIMQQLEISLDEACIVAQQIHDKDLKELLILWEYLPPNESLLKYMQQMITMLDALKHWYIHDTSRYAGT